MNQEQFCFNPKCWLYDNKMAIEAMKNGNNKVIKILLPSAKIPEFWENCDVQLVATSTPRDSRFIERIAFRIKDAVSYFCSDCAELLTTKGFRA